jgi:hypothetical protein
MTASRRFDLLQGRQTEPSDRITHHLKHEKSNLKQSLFGSFVTDREAV